MNDMTAIPQPRVSRLGLGCSRVGSFNNPASAAQQRDTILAALDLGITVFDTANVYGQGDSERTLGRVLAGRRDEAFLVTKCGKRFSAKMRALAPFKPILKPLLSKKAVTAQRGANVVRNFDPAGFEASLDGSLKRLGCGHVDALLLHSPAAEALTPEVAAALAAIAAKGKARRWGVSVDDALALTTALALPGIGAVQVPIDVLDASGRVLAAARARGVLVFAREVIRLAPPGVAPAQAVARAAMRADIDCTLVGASHRDRLAELVRAAEAASC